MNTPAKWVALSLGLALTWASTAVASPIVFLATNGDRSAAATFDVVDGKLTVELSNTATADALVPTDVLTAVYFDIGADPVFSPLSGTLLSGGGIYQGGQLSASAGSAGLDVGGEWAYASGINAPGGRSQGISAAGLGLFGSQDRFPGPDLDGQGNIGGLSYGLLSDDDNPATGNGGVGHDPLIQGTVRFVLGSVPSGFTLDDISNVAFQYGTSTSEPVIASPGPDPGLPVPEPAAMSMLALGGLLLGRRRR